jgi:hypothetical protein
MFVTEGDGTVSIHKRIINQKKSAVNINEFASNMHGNEENLLLIGKTTPIVSIDNDICNIIMLSLYTMESFLEQDTLTLLVSE